MYIIDVQGNTCTVENKEPLIYFHSYSIPFKNNNSVKDVCPLAHLLLLSYNRKKSEYV